MIGYITHHNTGIEIEDEFILDCPGEVPHYTIDFRLLSEAFSSLTLVNFGVVFPKKDHRSFEVKVRIDGELRTQSGFSLASGG